MSRKGLIQFFAINLALCMVIALNFLWLIPQELLHFIMTQNALWTSYRFVSLALIGQVGVLSLIVMSVIAFVVMGLRYIAQLCGNTQDRMFLLITAVFMSFLLVLLGIDFAVYRLIGYHLAGTFWTVLFSGAFFQVIVLTPIEWAILVLGFFLVLGFEALLILGVWRYGPFKSLSWLFMLLSATAVLACGYAYSFYFINQVPNRSIPQLAKVVPYFGQIANLIHPAKIAPALVYPQHPLVCHAAHNHMNVLIIVIDTWRADAFNADVTPNISDFAMNSLRFVNHYSGGNFTQPGIFSLLYGLTPNYWYQMQHQKKGPVLIHQFLKEGYALTVHTSASPRFPDFIDTVFRDVPAAWSDTPGLDSAQRDMTMTQEFQQFLMTHHTKQPFFGFLFYDEVHNWCGSAQPYVTPFQPATKICDRFAMAGDTNPLPYLNRYDNAVHYDDQLIGAILNQLKTSGILNHTIVMITADHGEEFNDNHHTIWGHGSAFDRYQLQVPFILYWPHKAPQVITYRTSHYDIVPTLMSDVLDCDSPFTYYTTGESLFSVVRPRYVLVGSYEHYAKLFERSVEITYSGGYNTLASLA